MSTRMLPAAKIPFLLLKVYLLRAVVASSVACSFLYIALFLDFAPSQLQLWLSLGLTLFILVHHLLMSLYINFLHGVGHLLLLLLEIAGLVFYIYFQVGLYPNYVWPTTGGRVPSSSIGIFVYSVLSFFLLLEVVIRIGSFTVYHRHQDSSQYQPLDLQLEVDNIKPYEIILGHSISRHFNEKEPTTHYNTCATQMKFVLTARKFLLRLMLPSCIGSLMVAPFAWPDGCAHNLWIALLPFITLHHLFSCINVEFYYCLADLPCLLFEIASIAYYIQNVGWFNEWSASTLMASSLLAWVIFVGLVLEALIWITALAVLITRHIRGLKSPSVTSQIEISKPYEVLFGHHIWKVHLTGETRVMRISRALIATGFILVVSFSSLTDIILGPIQETALTPTKDLRTLGIPESVEGEATVWNVVFTTRRYHHTSDSDWNSVFQAAVNVTPLWDNSTSHYPNPPCVHDPSATYHLGPGLPQMSGLYVNKVYCPPRKPIPQGFQSQIFPLAAPDSMPDLLITVNFTTLKIPIGNMINMFDNSMQIMIGLTNDTNTVVERTQATTLVPGVNLMSTISWGFRQVFKTPGLSAFGLFESYQTFVVAQVLAVFSDPLAGSLSIPRSPDISTFRVFMQNGAAELSNIQDYRTKSVLQGFSSLGGLWTFLGGVFAAIFGSSVLRILFGGKPLSFFGIAHSLQRKEIHKACHDEYPQIAEQISRSRSERDLLSLLCDQLINIGFLEVEEENNNKPIVVADHDMKEVEVEGPVESESYEMKEVVEDPFLSESDDIKEVVERTASPGSPQLLPAVNTKL